MIQTKQTNAIMKQWTYSVSRNSPT